MTTPLIPSHVCVCSVQQDDEHWHPRRIQECQQETGPADMDHQRKSRGTPVFLLHRLICFSKMPRWWAFFFSCLYFCRKCSWSPFQPKPMGTFSKGTATLCFSWVRQHLFKLLFSINVTLSQSKEHCYLPERERFLFFFLFIDIALSLSIWSDLQCKYDVRKRLAADFGWWIS